MTTAPTSPIARMTAEVRLGAQGGCIYTRIVLLSQIIKCFINISLVSSKRCKCQPEVSLLPPSGTATASLLSDWCVGWSTI